MLQFARAGVLHPFIERAIREPLRTPAESDRRLRDRIREPEAAEEGTTTAPNSPATVTHLRIASEWFAMVVRASSTAVSS